ncbi:MAG: hypothetical protein ACPGO3_15510 [Magnetospiraceae bacterium]
MVAPSRAADPGSEAFEAKDYKGAIALWEPEARAGSMLHQFNLAIAYETLGDRGHASDWYAHAARQGYQPAIDRLITLPFAGGYNNQASLNALSVLSQRAGGLNPKGLYELAQYYEARGQWYRQEKNEPTVDNHDTVDAWALYALAQEAGNNAAAADARRLWPLLQADAHKTAAERQMTRWRRSFSD